MPLLDPPKPRDMDARSPEMPAACPLGPPADGRSRGLALSPVAAVVVVSEIGGLESDLG